MDWALALFSGFVSGLALVIGAAVAWFVRVPKRVVATVMAFGSGVLISALSFDLIAEAAASGGFWPTMFGFLAGAVVYVGINLLLDARGARNRKGTADSKGSGTGIVVGALLDGIPETAVLGLSLVGGGQLSIPILAAIVISNFPEGLSATADLKLERRSAVYVFGLWGITTVACALSAFGGFALLQGAPVELTASVSAVAAGAILAMICDTMIPEAFDDAKSFTGLVAVVGFFSAFGIHQLG
ncbi:ZIP family metal transporter [Paramicrobacterium chengjingii]|uniref:ZIP family zinc transporter n=1 Tax=Paramicrobacterium chengjingii TaxID=2769067 RepID=A0ABX6YFP4_9MICO|nr:ZIP family zinc transporter [Microbacterium chengjingii]QPZ37613.1 ZIP family zinc transporter [Microbacterium chengjingii]